MQKSLLPVFLLALIFAFAGCDDEDNYVGTPRPRGYFRIAMPEKKYVNYDEACPFSFEIPQYAQMYQSAAPGAAPCWKDLYFKPFRATLYLSYNDIDNDTILRSYVNDSWQLLEAHHNVAMGFRDTAIVRPEDKVYGTIFTLGGNAASQVQFYLTDSTDHFLRGSLYFYAMPNRDSIAPVLDYIRKDIVHMATTLKWKPGPETIRFVPPTVVEDMDGPPPPPAPREAPMGTKE